MREVSSELLTVHPIWDIMSKKGYIMSKTQTTIRLEEDDYKEAKDILKYIGMSYSQAVNMFNRMIVLEKGLPFEAKIPNDITKAAMKEALELDGEFITIDDLKREHESISN